VTGAATVPDMEPWTVLEGHDVVLWPDNDGPGFDHMARTAEKRRTLGITPRSMVWTDVPEKGDAADWFELPHHRPRRPPPRWPEGERLPRAEGSRGAAHAFSENRQIQTQQAS